MSMGLVRRNVNIYGEQWLWLRRRAYEAGISVSAALRDVIAEAMDRVQVDVIHPATGQAVTIDGTMVTAERLEALAAVMDDDVREAIHRQLAPCSPYEFWAEYVRRAGAEEAGRIWFS